MTAFNLTMSYRPDPLRLFQSLTNCLVWSEQRGSEARFDEAGLLLPCLWRTVSSLD